MFFILIKWEKQLNLNSFFSLDIIHNNKEDIAICNSFSDNNNSLTLSCSSQDYVYQDEIVQFRNKKSIYSSINWTKPIDECNHNWDLSLRSFPSSFMQPDVGS